MGRVCPQPYYQRLTLSCSLCTAGGHLLLLPPTCRSAPLPLEHARTKYIMDQRNKELRPLAFAQEGTGSCPKWHAPIAVPAPPPRCLHRLALENTLKYDWRYCPVKLHPHLSHLPPPHTQAGAGERAEVRVAVQPREAAAPPDLWQPQHRSGAVLPHHGGAGTAVAGHGAGGQQVPAHGGKGVGRRCGESVEDWGVPGWKSVWRCRW